MTVGVVAAVLAAVPAPSAEEPVADRVVVVDPPRVISMRLADGIRIGGECTRWSGESCEGVFGQRRWSDVHPDDVDRVIHRLMDDAVALHWVILGEAQLRLGRDDDAERSFLRALRLDASTQAVVGEVRAEVAARRAADEARRRQVESERLSTRSPEAGDWPATPWPALSRTEREQAALAVRGEAERILRDAGSALTPIEVDRVILFGDMDRRAAARWALRLDALNATLASLLGLDAGESLVYGRLAVLVHADQDRFRLVEAQAFDHLPARSVTALSHPRGAMAIVNAYVADDERVLADALVRAAVVGYLHRYRTPRRLPAWANDGLAAYVAATTLDDSLVDDQLRPLALRFIRGGGDVRAVLAETYQGDWWPGPDELGPALGHLLVELMIRTDQRRFVAWVNAVKHGKPWPQALREDYGMTPDALVALFVRFYMVND